MDHPTQGTTTGGRENDELMIREKPKSVRSALPARDINTLCWQRTVGNKYGYIHLSDRCEIWHSARECVSSAVLLRSQGTGRRKRRTQRQLRYTLTNGRESTESFRTYWCAFPLSIHAGTMKIVQSKSVVVPRNERIFL